MSVYSALIRKTILPLVLRRDHRESAIKHWSLFKKSQFWPRQQLLDWQWQRLQALLKHAYDTSPFYTRAFDERGLKPADLRGLEDLSKLPMLTRDHLFDHMDELISSRFDRASLQRFTTGGSTGQRAVLYRNQECFNAKLALEWRHESWMGRLPGDKMALIWPAAIDLELHPSWKDQIKNRYILRRLLFYANSQNEAELERTYQGLLNFRPDFLKVFPSNLQILAEYLKETGRSLPGIRAIQSTGEPMLGNQRLLFDEVFGCPIFDMYGSREVGNTSCECDHHEGLHIAMESSIVEIVREGSPVPVGEEGEILVTDLCNYGVPMIRYQINDYGRLITGGCSCGRELTLMSAGVGRVTDDIFAADGTRFSGQLIGVYLVDENPHVGQMQIVQRSFTEFTVRITNKPKPTQANFDYINNVMHRVLGAEINITFEVLEAIPQEASGKVRFIKSELPAR